MGPVWPCQELPSAAHRRWLVFLAPRDAGLDLGVLKALGFRVWWLVVSETLRILFDVGDDSASRGSGFRGLGLGV